MPRCHAPKVLALLSLALWATPSSADVVRPSVLVHCARPSVDQWYWWVDLRYLGELHAAGFEVDYTDRHADFTWERVRRYDVLVLYTVPLERGAYYDNSPDAPPYRDEFIAIVERFLESGGGVLLLARSLNGDESFLPLLRGWGARIPHERIVETDPENIVPMPRMRGIEKLWFTDHVSASPVGEGVRQVWLPLTEHYSAVETMPIEVDPSWQVVLSGPPSSRTEPIDPAKASMPPPPERRVRTGGVREPPLFAIREYRGGRVAFGAIWPQYSIGQGTEWLYERRVLSAGYGGRPSDFGRLIENTLSWLAEPALGSEAVGGFVTDPTRLVPPNERPRVRERFVLESRRPALDPARALAAARDSEPIWRGLIGAQSELGSGHGSIAEYARVARETGLHFVVFLEDHARLDERRFQQLAAQCAEHSGSDLRLWPGYRIETNSGSRMFVYGDGATLPPPALVVGGELKQQERDPGTGSLFIDWINYRLQTTNQVNIGYYGFTDRPHAPAMADLRFYSAVALRLYAEGSLVEDNLEAYLETAAGTIPPTPVALHLLTSPAALERAVRGQTGLTYVQTAGVTQLWDELGYAHQYAAPSVFVSDGPTFHGWPRAVQYYTFAAESYVTEAAYMPLPIVVRSAAGLSEIRLYNGDRLFRRFLPKGERSFEVLLELTASVAKTLVIVAQDVSGKTAVSNAWRAWKGGDTAPLFCGDRVNHCDDAPLMAKGPGIIPVSRTPAIVAGHTWDGGPRGERPVLSLVDAERPVLRSDRGVEGERGWNNRAVLELADEGAVRVRYALDTLYDERVPVVNAWLTYGPLGGPSRLMRAQIAFTGFNRPTLGPHPDMWPGLARRRGAAVSLFESQVTLKRELRADSLLLFRQRAYTGPFFLMHGRGDDVLERLDLSPGKRRPERMRLSTGEWIGVWGRAESNLTVLWNRGAELTLAFPGGSAGLAIQFLGGGAGRYEVLSIVDPLDGPPAALERVLEIVRYMRRHGSAGLVELFAQGGAVAFETPRPAQPVFVPLPLRVSGLNPRWSAGVALDLGYVLGNYGEGRDRYREAAVDSAGRVWATLFPDLAQNTRVRIGHPVVSDDAALFIQVTRRDDRGLPSSWHVAVNNPRDDEVRATFSVALQLPGLAVPREAVTVPAGGYVVLQ